MSKQPARTQRMPFRILLIGAFLPAVLIAGFLVYNNFFGKTSYPSNPSGITESDEPLDPELLKAAEQLAEKTFYKNSSAEGVRIPGAEKIFTRYSTFIIRGSDKYFPYPSASVVLIDKRDRQAFIMPLYFNDAIKKEGITVEDEETALMLSKIYVLIDDREAIFLDSYKDIPRQDKREEAADPYKFRQEISAPAVRKNTGQYSVKMFVWTPAGGEIRRWDFLIEKNGEMSKAEKESIASKVGDFKLFFYE